MTVVKPSDGPLPAGWVETGPPNVTVETEHGAVQLFYIDSLPSRFLCVDVVEGEVVDGSVDDPLIASVALDENRARILRDSITAWLDAPRLAARATAEVVASDPTNDIELVKTTAGEWGVLAIEAAFDDDGKATGNERRAIEWFSGDGCESSARVLYAEERGKSLCESCLKETGLDGLIEAGESGPMVCESCADAAFDAFQTTRYRCDACKWSGTGADVPVEDDAALCPKCSDFVEVAP